MGIDQLAATLQQEQAATGQIVIDNALCGRQDIDAFLTYNIYRSNIILLVANGGIGPVMGDRLTVVGTVAAGDDGFLNLAGRLVTVTFVELGEIADFILVFNLGDATDPMPWNFAVSYPGLLGSLAEFLPAKAQKLLLSTSSFGDQAPQGLTYEAYIQLTGPYAPLATLTALMGSPTTQAYLKTPIRQVTGGIQVAAVSAMIQGSLDLVLLQISGPELLFNITTLPSPSLPGTYASFAEFGVRMSTYLGAAGLVGLTAWTIFNYETVKPIIQLNIAPAPGTTVTIDQLGNLMGGASWDALFTGSIGNSLRNCFRSFGFLSWSAGFYADGLRSSFTNSVLVLGSMQPIVLVQDFLTLSYLQASWMAIAPSPTGVSNFGVAARLDMPNGIHFDIDLQYGNTRGITLSGVLASEQPDNNSLTTWLNTFAAGFGLSPIPANVATVLDDFSLSLIGVDLAQADDRTAFSLRILGGMMITGQSVDFELSMRYVLTGSAWAYTIGCRAIVGAASFEGIFASDPAKSSFTVSWASADNPLGLAEIAETLGFELPSIPDALDLDLVAASFTYDTRQNLFLLTASSANWGKTVLAAFQQGPDWVFAYNMAIQKETQVNALPLVNLSNLPLINQILTGQETLGVDLQVVVTSAPLTQELTSLLNGHLEDLPQFPAEGFAGGWGFAIAFNFGGNIVPISMGMEGEETEVQRNTPHNSTVGATTTNSPIPVTPQGVPSSDGTIWVNVQKTFGPVSFQKVGVRYEAEKLWFVLDANLQMGGLSLEVLGLRVGSPLDTFAPDFGIDGLGIDYRSAGFELGGALLNMHPANGLQFAGIAVARAFGISATLMGSYGQLTVGGRTVTTMFLFGSLSGLAIGQPYLMLTAIAGGMGYNSSLRIPSAAAVGNFPFVAGLTDASKLGGANAKPMDVLQTLMLGTNGQPPWVSAAVGQSWVAAGLSFSSFGYLNMSALAVVEFGNELNVSLLGMMTAQFPKSGSAWARLQLNLVATYRASEGALAFTAVMGAGSFLLDPSVVILGGLAMRNWSKGVHAGDYVVTVGGYHPRFSVPTWYPRVDRVGISWSLGSALSIRGTAYLAFMPGAMMVGGSLNVNYTYESLRAWFSAGFDALIKYAPFAYDVNVGVTVGASYTVDKWYCTKTFTVELGCNLRMWGPPTGGKVVVDWWVFSFEINFGVPAVQGNAATRNSTWAEFQTLLPPKGQYCVLAADTGLLGSAPAQGGGQIWSVSRQGFTVSTASSIPLSGATRSGVAIPKPTSTPAVNILPMGLSNLASVQTMTLSKKGSNGQFAVQSLSNWTSSALQHNLPKALWGTGSANTLPVGTQLINNAWTGVVLASPPPTIGSGLTAFPVSNLSANTSAATLPFPLLTQSAAVGPVPSSQADAAHTVIASINSPAARNQRNAILQGFSGMGFQLPAADGAGTPLGWSTESLFEAQPLIIPSTKL